ncbi:hypothetical protein [Flavobacterium tegetincola]|uniref:hypothetical protein n=1 Tax=Flavobacterium tegetincola TaxID=150172 RepID=UPI0004000B9D|nr:hypothetical protein [Flavobacterium tegetincola]
MARKDEIFNSFIKHELIADKYSLTVDQIPTSLKEGLKSNHTIIKTIALIVENSEGISPTSDRALYTMITQFLSEATT